MSSRPATKPSCSALDSPSLIESFASGSASRKARVSGTVSTRATLVGRPTATRPARPPRRRPRSSRARSTWCRMPRPCCSSSLPASVGTAPRPLRTSRFWRSSTSSSRTWRDSAGWATSISIAARVKLPSSATRTKYSSCLRSMGGIPVQQLCRTDIAARAPAAFDGAAPAPTIRAMTAKLLGISSMATRGVLDELAKAYEQRSGQAVKVESVGGVDAARRVAAGEPFDFVVLAADAIDKLIASGQAVAGSRVDLVDSGVSVAVKAGAQRPDISSEQALKRAVLAAPTVGYSTGPSGVALVKLFQRWGIAQELQGRMVQAPPGIPVGSLVARGEAALGFQQLSELIHLEGIEVVGPMPAAVEINTVFSGALCKASAQPEAVRKLLAFMASADAAAAKHRNGMEPAA